MSQNMLYGNFQQNEITFGHIICIYTISYIVTVMFLFLLHLVLPVKFIGDRPWINHLGSKHVEAIADDETDSDLRRRQVQLDERLEVQNVSRTFQKQLPKIFGALH